MTTLVFDCEMLAEHVEAYLERALPQTEAKAFEAHMESCDACRKSVHYSRAVGGLIDYVGARPSAPEAAIAQTAVRVSVLDRFTGAPWWLVSASLHILIIALASLISMGIELPRNDDAVIMVTELQQRAELKDQQTEKPKAELQDVMAKLDAPPTDINSKEASDIVVPPDILARAELGDHFETENLDKPDTHSAFGNEQSHSFHSIEGNAEPPGGGGMGGLGMDDLIGVGGAASRGTGGGFGGGNGTGIGVQSGAGKGSFGQRNGGGRKLMVMRHGGSKATESAVDKALQWLAYHQDPDGHWDCVKYGGGADWNGPGKGHKYDTAVTGLALLAFLGAGHTEKVGQWKENVQRAVGWLKNAQSDNGGIKGDILAGSGYEHAIMTMALAEAAGMANVPETRAAAQKSVDYCTEIHQQGEGSEKGAWRYGVKNEPDISVTGWFVMALKSAKVAGLHVNHASFDGAMSFLDKVEVKNAAAGADAAYGPVLNYTYQPGHETNIYRTSAIGLLCRQFMGRNKDDLQNSVEWFVNKGGTIKAWPTDMYYCYYGTLCVFQEGGDVWKRWNEDMKKTLVENQRKDGDETGSWNPDGVLSSWWGRVGETSLCTLSLEVYYRYLQLNAGK